MLSCFYDNTPALTLLVCMNEYITLILPQCVSSKFKNSTLEASKSFLEVRGEDGARIEGKEKI